MRDYLIIIIEMDKSPRVRAFHFANGTPVDPTIPILIECFITQRLIARDVQKSAKASGERCATAIR